MLRTTYATGLNWESGLNRSWLATAKLEDLGARLCASIERVNRDGEEFWTWKLELVVGKMPPILLQYGVTQLSLPEAQRLVEYVVASQSVTTLALLSSAATGKSLSEYLSSRQRVTRGVLLEQSF